MISNIGFAQAVGFLLLLTLRAHGASTMQDTTLRISGFADVYYAYDFNRPTDRNRNYTTQPARHNEFNLNWGFIKADYTRGPIRSSFALQAGTYVSVNYAYEPEALRAIYQASIGYQLNDKIWIDAGIMPSHIGIESAISTDNWNYSRNMASDFSPYYQCGVHISIVFSEKFVGKLAVLNGFQIIKDNNEAKSLGVLLNYNFSEKLSMGYSNYFGNEAPSDSMLLDEKKTMVYSKYRFFNDLYVRWSPHSRFSLAFVGEYNVQEQWANSSQANWYTVVIKAKYALSHKLSFASRFEYYADTDQIIVLTDTSHGFQVKSSTLSINYTPESDVAFRIECRSFKSKDPIFPSNTLKRKNDAFVTVSGALKF